MRRPRGYSVSDALLFTFAMNKRLPNTDDKQSNNETTMSYWDQDELKGASTGGYFIKMADGETRTFTYHGHAKRPQKEGTDARFKTADGMEFEFKFTEKNKDGVEEERAFTNPKASNALTIGMKQAGIEPGDTFTVTRTGSGMDTRYLCLKQDASGNTIVPEITDLGAGNPF